MLAYTIANVVGSVFGGGGDEYGGHGCFVVIALGVWNVLPISVDTLLRLFYKGER